MSEPKKKDLRPRWRRRVAFIMDVCFYTNIVLVLINIAMGRFGHALGSCVVAICCWVGGELNRDPEGLL